MSNQLVQTLTDGLGFFGRSAGLREQAGGLGIFGILVQDKKRFLPRDFCVADGDVQETKFEAHREVVGIQFLRAFQIRIGAHDPAAFIINQSELAEGVSVIWIELHDVPIFDFRLRILAGEKVFVGFCQVAVFADLLGAACEREAGERRREEVQFFQE